MKQQNNSGPLPWLLLAVPVLWVGAALASGYQEDMTIFDLMGCFSIILERPFDIRWTPYTLKIMVVALVLYAFAVTLYFSSRQNKRPGEEHGSAHWGNVHTLNLKYRDKDPHNNVILTQNLRMSLNGRKHLRNLLQIVVGGSGSGKTRYVVKPSASVRAE